MLAVDNLGLASACLQLLEVVFTGISLLTGYATLGTAASFLGPLALILAVAALLVYLVYLFKNPPEPKDPIQDFIYGKRVRDAGLFMDVTAVDYLDIIAPKDGKASFAGLSFKSLASKYIHIDNTTPEARRVDMIDECTNMPDSVWSLSTDYRGISSIWTSLQGSALILTALENRTVTVLPRPYKFTMLDGEPVPVPPAEYNKNVAQQQWTIEIVSYSEGGQKASCRIRNASMYLKQAAAKNILELSDDAANSLWALDMQQVGPSSFSFMALGDDTPWPLTTDNLDEHIFPVPSNPYTASYPLECSVSPPFPLSSNLELVVGSKTIDDGTIRIKPELYPGLMKETTFAVQSTAKVRGRTITAIAKVKIEITLPAGVNSLGKTEFEDRLIVEDDKFDDGDEDDDLWPMTDLTLYTLQNSATPLFLLSQVASIAFLQDPVVKMFINLIQKSITGSWAGGDYKGTFFPGLVNYSPDSLTVPALRNFDYRGAVSAFIAKAAYNADPKLKPNIQQSEFDSTISSTNTFFSDHASDFYVEFIRYYFHIKPNGTILADYLTIIKAKNWRNIRYGQAYSGKWPFPGPAMEMYLHFIKLSACRASDDQIADVFTTLTTEEPVIPASIFSGLTGTNWRSYRGWISTGVIDFGSFNIQNILAYTFVYVSSSDQYLTFDADEEYAKSNGYYENPSSSCFPADTLVVQADGSCKRIEDVRQGDRVLSPSNYDSMGSSREVAFVTRPKRSGRPLYRFQGSDIEFTSTHPIVTQLASAKVPGSKHTLSFVDPGLAQSLIPSWGILKVNGIKPSSLEYCYPTTQPDVDESILYDLIFEPDGSGNPATFVVANEGGAEIIVASESPISDIFPHSALFFSHCLPTLGNTKILKDLHEEIREGSFDWLTIFDRAIQGAHAGNSSKPLLNNGVNSTSTTSNRSSLSIHQLLHSSHSEPQEVADIVESLISIIGPTINCTIHYGWRSALSTHSHHSSFGVIFIDFLHFFRPKPNPLHETEISINGQAITFDPVGLPSSNLLSAYHSSKANFAILPMGKTTNLDITGKLGKTSFISATNPVTVGSPSRISLFSAGSRRKHIATIVVEVGRVTDAEWERRSSWGEGDMVAFAEAFGKAFPKETLDAFGSF